MKDRITQGMIAGIGGWVPQFIFTMTMYFGFHFTKLRYLDFAGIFAFNHQPRGLLELIFAESIVIGQMMGFGILFSMIIKLISSRNLLFKGTFFGGFCWFTIYVLAVLYKTKGIYGVVDFKTATINLVGSLIWGLGMAWAFQFINRRYNTAKGAYRS